MAMRLSGPNKGLELTASSVRSCLAPASGSSSGLALGAKGAGGKMHKGLWSNVRNVSEVPGKPSSSTVFPGILELSFI
jgi:hypothetical protein